MFCFSKILRLVRRRRLSGAILGGLKEQVESYTWCCFLSMLKGCTHDGAVGAGAEKLCGPAHVNLSTGTERFANQISKLRRKSATVLQRTQPAETVSKVTAVWSDIVGDSAMTTVAR